MAIKISYGNISIAIVLIINIIMLQASQLTANVMNANSGTLHLNHELAGVVNNYLLHQTNLDSYTSYAESRATDLILSQVYRNYEGVALIASDSSITTLLDNNSVSGIEGLSKEELIKKEIQKLHEELDGLNEKISILEKENARLKEDIDTHNINAKLQEERDTLISELAADVRKYKSSINVLNAPENYVLGLDYLITGSLDLAQQSFKTYITSLSNGNKNAGEAAGVNPKASSNTFSSYTHFWLGRINSVNKEYSNAVTEYSLTYKSSDNNILSLMALLRLIESLTHLSKTTEACIALKQFNQDYKKIKDTPNVVLGKDYLDLLDKLTDINKCH